MLASSVASATKISRDWKPDVMLLDLTLPDGNGLTVLQLLRDENIAAPRTIALSGHDDDELSQLCLDAGCTDVLLKPVPIARLLELVRSP
jgi:DNA-binding response OmpR family regulator